MRESVCVLWGIIGFMVVSSSPEETAMVVSDET